MSNKAEPVETGGGPIKAEAPKPTMHLDGAHVPQGVQAGDHVEFSGHGKVVSHSTDTHGEDGKPQQRATIEVHGLKHHKKGKKGSDTGRVPGRESDLQDGGKAAMDQALSSEAAADAE